MPFRITVCAVPAFPESSLTLSAPVTEPGADGVKLTETAQFDPGCSVLGQLLSCEKTPPAETVSPLNGLPPKLLIVIV